MSVFTGYDAALTEPYDRFMENGERLAELEQAAFDGFVDELAFSPDGAGDLVWKQSDTHPVAGSLMHAVATGLQASASLEAIGAAVKSVFIEEVVKWAKRKAESQQNDE